MGKGWISIHRKIEDNWVWQDRPFSYGQAWIDLIILANHEDNKGLKNGKLQTFKAGTVNRSILWLSNRWGWDRKKTSRFIKLLESDQMVSVNSTTHGTTITLINYEVYRYQGATDGAMDGTTDGQPLPQPLPINNNENNENNENNNIYNVGQDIIKYLNEKTGKRFSSHSKSTMKHINGRLKEGYTVDDFKKVIDNKVSQWKGNDRMEGYLRPETLFCASHFESYLNEGINQPSSSYDDISERLLQETINNINNIKLEDEDYDRFA